jgi:hypothetical protein
LDCIYRLGVKTQLDLGVGDDPVGVAAIWVDLAGLFSPRQPLLEVVAGQRQDAHATHGRVVAWLDFQGPLKYPFCFAEMSGIARITRFLKVGHPKLAVRRPIFRIIRQPLLQVCDSPVGGCACPRDGAGVEKLILGYGLGWAEACRPPRIGDQPGCGDQQEQAETEARLPGKEGSPWDLHKGADPVGGGKATRDNSLARVSNELRFW